MEEYRDERGAINVNKMYADLLHYKGFYEGIKTITNLIEDENIEEDDLTVECAFGKLEGKDARKFKDFIDNLMKGAK